jgi:hypothetical protein
MTFSRPILVSFALASILAGALLTVRWITPEFATGSLTENHPVITLCSALVIGGTAWFALTLGLRKTYASAKTLLPFCLLLGLGLRLAFFGSTPVYENDYKRYLWDGAVTAAGDNPYRFSPAEIFEAGEPGARSIPDLARLAIKSNDADFITGEINSSTLTTIYPPAAQAAFAAAHVIAPYKPWGLKLVFLLFEIAAVVAILAGLRARNLPLLWSAAYWLNPVIIFTTYNGIHMDVLLVAPLVAALLSVRRHPFLAAIFLALAASIKIWPLLLAPVLFRAWRHRPLIYIGVAAVVAVLTALSLAPMIISLNPNSGLAAYSANWTNSSFLFPGLRDTIGLLFDNSDRIARYVIAITLTAMSLWLGFLKPKDEMSMPAHLMLLAGAFVLLSPTGYPWYFIWFLMFLPFAITHWSARGLALLTIGAAAYFARFQIGEAGHYYIYAKILLPIEFGIPLLVLAWDGWKEKQHV